MILIIMHRVGFKRSLVPCYCSVKAFDTALMVCECETDQTRHGSRAVDVLQLCQAPIRVVIRRAIGVQVRSSTGC